MSILPEDKDLLSALQSSPIGVKIEPGEVITGRVIAKEKGKILVDLGGVSTGVISGRELIDPFGTAKKCQIGDEVLVFVLEDENEEGMVVLSFRKASQMRAWDKFLEMKESGETMEVVAKEANKGGLMVDAMGVKAFLPVSQLAPVHYPRVDGANAQAILSHLEGYLNQKFTVRVITIDMEVRKVVVSEREAMSDIRDKELANVHVGDIVKGTVNGLVKFGAFVTFGTLEGLIHISEITWGHIKTPGEALKIGQEMECMIIGIDGEKVSLSTKRLMPDPWIGRVKAFEIGSRVKGTVNKVSEYGIFVTLGDDVTGLVHNSEFSSSEDGDRSQYQEGDSVDVTVLEINESDHSLKLSFKTAEEKAGKKAASKKEKAKEEEGEA
ncbi:MAG: S1 RNA-binding domain-containing protein [Candidatus Peregrinibacteria bacterium]